MADNSLQALLSTKAALDLGLVTDSDYDAVKSSFLKAQQLRAALDAGLMKEEDFDAAKAEYFAALSVQPVSGAPPLVRSQPSSNGPVPNAAAARSVAPPPPPPTLRVPTPAEASAPPAAGPPRASSAQGTTTLSRQSTIPKVPSSIPAVGGAKPISGSSMSGISLTEDAVNLYYLIRAKSAYRWAL